MTETFTSLVEARGLGDSLAVARIEAELYDANYGLVIAALESAQGQATVKLLGSREDVEQEVALELVEAIRRFDPTIGAFSTYAFWRLRLGLVRAGRGQLQSEPVRTPWDVRSELETPLVFGESLDADAFRLDTLIDSESGRGRNRGDEIGAEDSRIQDMCNLMDVERLIELAELTSVERVVIADFMQGKSCARSETGYRKDSNRAHLKRALAKLRAAAGVDEGE